MSSKFKRGEIAEYEELGAKVKVEILGIKANQYAEHFRLRVLEVLRASPIDEVKFKKDHEFTFYRGKSVPGLDFNIKISKIA